MYKIIPFMLLSLMISSSDAYQCKKEFLTQWDMNDCSYNIYLDADKTLNRVFNRVITKYKNYSPDAIFSAIKAERAWEIFRNTQLAMKFPPLKKGHFYGSIHSVFISDYLTDLTNQRIAQLKEILKDKYVDEANK